MRFPWVNTLLPHNCQKPLSDELLFLARYPTSLGSARLILIHQPCNVFSHFGILLFSFYSRTLSNPTLRPGTFGISSKETQNVMSKYFIITFSSLFNEIVQAHSFFMLLIYAKTISTLFLCPLPEMLEMCVSGGWLVCVRCNTYSYWEKIKVQRNVWVMAEYNHTLTGNVYLLR